MKNWSARQWSRLACYFCELTGEFERTKFIQGRMPEVACPKCKHLIKEAGGRKV